MWKTYNFPQGYPLELLPGAAVLNPKTRVNNISITLAPVQFVGPSNSAGPRLFDFKTMAYIDDTTGTANVFGPTLRVRRGDGYTVRVTNSMVQKKQVDAENWIHNYANTNLHTHGMHAETGVPSQETATTYFFGDNPFFDIEARNSTSEAPNGVLFSLIVPPTHMPGLHWYHPHLHGRCVVVGARRTCCVCVGVCVRGDVLFDKQPARLNRHPPHTPSHTRTPLEQKKHKKNTIKFKARRCKWAQLTVSS